MNLLGKGSWIVRRGRGAIPGIQGRWKFGVAVVLCGSCFGRQDGARGNCFVFDGGGDVEMVVGVEWVHQGASLGPRAEAVVVLGARREGTRQRT